MIKIIFAGGKTGGHVFPAITMATEFKRRFPQSRIVFVGTEDGLERRVVPRYGFELSFIRTRGISRKSYLSNLLLVFHLLRGLHQAHKVLSRERPNLVVGTGGYVSFPVVMLAGLTNIPTMIQEQNSYPGMATRFLAHFVDSVCLSYSESRKYFSGPHKLRVMGNPVRADLMNRERDRALEQFGLEQGKKTVFVLGGSQGAHAINKVFLQCLDLLATGWQVLWQAGERDFPEISRAVKGKPIACAVHPFVQDMGSAYAASDLVVSRAGASTLAEITADHQRYNAQVLQKEGAARMILQRELTAQKLAHEMQSLLSDESELERMAQRSRKMGVPEAASLLVNEMEKLLKKDKECLIESGISKS
jgi:UDP-N-acetylglucosamine--N-acetylmuramyl-(pentapeptide) pyrophosphoryl-undecaprenol N-acetylglucosamine transferase